MGFIKDLALMIAKNNMGVEIVRFFYMIIF
jgi:hypothetical protein